MGIHGKRDNMVMEKLNSDPALVAEQEKVLLDAGYDVERLKVQGSWFMVKDSR